MVGCIVVCRFQIVEVCVVGGRHTLLRVSELEYFICGLSEDHMIYNGHCGVPCLLDL